MTSRRRILLFKMVCCSVPTILVVGLVVGFLVIVALTFDTEYSGLYSELAFDRVRQGDTKEAVLELLCEPLSSRYVDTYETWVYSCDEQNDFARTGRARGAYIQVLFDWNGVVSGGWADRLLTDSEYIRLHDLRGQSRSDVEKTLGSPTAGYCPALTPAVLVVHYRSQSEIPLGTTRKDQQMSKPVSRPLVMLFVASDR